MTVRDQKPDLRARTQVAEEVLTTGSAPASASALGPLSVGARAKYSPLQPRNDHRGYGKQTESLVPSVAQDVYPDRAEADDEPGHLAQAAAALQQAEISLTRLPNPLDLLGQIWPDSGSVLAKLAWTPIGFLRFITGSGLIALYVLTHKSRERYLLALVIVAVVSAGFAAAAALA